MNYFFLPMTIYLKKNNNKYLHYRKYDIKFYEMHHKKSCIKKKSIEKYVKVLAFWSYQYSEKTREKWI